MPAVAQTEEIEIEEVLLGPMRARWRDLGTAAGSVGVGVVRGIIEPGARSTPQHRHGREEEFVFVLGGSGVSWQDDATYAIGPGDCLVHRVNEEAHTLVAGPDGLDVLIYGMRETDEATHLPRAGIVRINETWADTPGPPDPWEREAALGDDDLPAQPSPRPDRIAALADVPAERNAHGPHDFVERDLGRHLGSVATGLCHLSVAPGRESWPPHCHAAEEELFVVLEGAGTLTLGDDETHPVRAGSVVARPAGSRVTHAFAAAAEEPLVYLAYGTRRPEDIVFYPRTGLASIRGIGRVVRTEPRPASYWDLTSP